MEISAMKKFSLSALNPDFINNLNEMDEPIKIVITSEKGGVGKSHLAGTICNSLNNVGVKCRLIDCDVQGTAYAQSKKREATIAAEIASEILKLNGNFKKKAQAKIDELESLAHYEVVRHPMSSNFNSLFKVAKNDGYKVIIIDTPCHLTEEHAVLINACDIALFPFNNSDDDFNSNKRVNKFIQNIKESNSKFNTHVFSVITDQSNVSEKRNQEITEEWKDFANSHPLLKSRLVNRQVCRDVKRHGMGLCEVSGKYAPVAAGEAMAVLKEAVESAFSVDETEENQAA